MAASVPFSSSSLCLVSERKVSCLGFSYGVSDNLRRVSDSIGFKKNRGVRARVKVRVSICKAGSVAFRDLDANGFRHPLDKQNTLLLSAIPELNEPGKALLGSITEQFMLLENIGTSVLVSKNQIPEMSSFLSVISREFRHRSAQIVDTFIE